jgi:hypothetical protein
MIIFFFFSYHYYYFFFKDISFHLFIYNSGMIIVLGDTIVTQLFKNLIVGKLNTNSIQNAIYSCCIRLNIFFFFLLFLHSFILNGSSHNLHNLIGSNIYTKSGI